MADLDALDPAELKSMIFAQHNHYQTEHERYTATLTSRTAEIERLVLLVEKLQQSKRVIFPSGASAGVGLTMS